MPHASGRHARPKRDRIAVDDHLRILGVEHACAIGDVAAAPDRNGQPLPMTLAARDAGRPLRRAPDPAAGDRGRPFRYFDKGTLATIGRRAAVAQIGPIQLTGFIGWVAWLVVHLYYLIGFENRLRVLMRWGWYYVRLDRPVRAILRADPPQASDRAGNGYRHPRVEQRPCPFGQTDLGESHEERWHGDRRDHQGQPRRTVTDNDIVLRRLLGRAGADRAASSARCSSRPSADNPDLVFGKVDTEAQPELGAAFNVMSIPTLMIFREQVLVFSQPGALPAPALDGPHREGARARHERGARRDRQAAGDRRRSCRVDRPLARRIGPRLACRRSRA